MDHLIIVFSVMKINQDHILSFIPVEQEEIQE